MDIIIHTSLDPRIIEVLSPITDVTVQEIVNAVRDWEDDNLSFKSLIGAAGKESLGGGVTVGITATLQNAQLMFTGRTTALESGGTCTSDDVKGKVLKATGGLFITNNIYPGCTVFNYTTGGMSAVSEVISETELKSFQLSGGSRDTWLINDIYDIYPNVQCAITGGNLVAIDDLGNSISPVIQSPNVQVVRSSSSSATLQELGSIQYSSFNGGVTIDIANGVPGTAFPIGTPRDPVNNLTDALAIANSRGFITFFINQDLLIDSAEDFSNLIFIGESVSKSEFIIESASNVLNCEFYNAKISGVLDGNCVLRECLVDNLEYFYGVIIQCILDPGTITLGGNNHAHFLDCWSGAPGVNLPTINCGGSGQSLSLQNYNGKIKIMEKTGTDVVNVALNAGEITLDSTVTNGTIDIDGVGNLIDNSSGSAIVSYDGLISPSIISESVWEKALSESKIVGSAGLALNDILDESLGKWFLDHNANTLTLYRIDGTVLKVFDLTTTTGSVPVYTGRNPQ